MKFLLEVNDEKVGFIKELLEEFSFVEIEPLSAYQATVLKGIAEAAHEVNQVKSGVVKSQPLSDFLNEI